MNPDKVFAHTPPPLPRHLPHYGKFEKNLIGLFEEEEGIFGVARIRGKTSFVRLWRSWLQYALGPELQKNEFVGGGSARF